MFDKKFKELIEDHVEEIMVATDKDGCIIWVNKWFTELTKYTFDEVKGKKPGSFLQGVETNKATVKKMREAINKGESFKVNIINYSKENEKYWLNISCSPIYNDKKEVEYFLAIERNITSEYQINQNRLNKLIEEQEKLSEEKSELIQLIYKLSHDLKVPLNNIEGLVNISEIANDKINKMLCHEVARTKSLIDKILSNNDATTGKINLKIENFNLCNIINYLVDINEITLEKSKLKVLINCAKEITLSTDKILFTQIIENLFTNALKYSNISTEIIFDISEKENDICLEISNETNTLEEWQLNNMFQPFQNFSLQTSEKSNGIGSYIIKNHTNLLKGTIKPYMIGNRVYFQILIPKNY